MEKSSKIKIAYYTFPLGISWAHVDEKINVEYLIAYTYNYQNLIENQQAFNLCGVLRPDVTSVGELSSLNKLKSALLFGEVILMHFPKRGLLKWRLIAEEEKDMTLDSLPKMYYSSGIDSPYAGNLFLMERGKYYAYDGRSATYEEVKDLESNTLHGAGLLSFTAALHCIRILHPKSRTLSEWLDLGYKIVSNSQHFVDMDEKRKVDFVQLYLKSVLKIK